MTGNNLTYALIPRLSRCILSAGLSFARARSARLFYFCSTPHGRGDARYCKVFFSMYLHGQLRRMATMHSLVAAADEPAVSPRISTIAHSSIGTRSRFSLVRARITMVPLFPISRCSLDKFILLLHVLPFNRRERAGLEEGAPFSL